MNQLLEEKEEEDNKKLKYSSQKEYTTKGTRSIIYMSLSLVLSVLSNIFFKAVTSNSSPVYTTYFQCLSFLVFLPFSFVTVQFENLIFGKVKAEEETTNEEMTIIMDDSFSEIMDKKFYETYYRYYKSYYKNALVLAGLYFISYLLYYISIILVNPVFCLCMHSGIGLIINLFKIIQKGIRIEPFIISSIIYSGVIFVFSLIEFFLEYDLRGNNKALGIILAIIGDILIAMMISYLKNIFKKFPFYLNFGEFSGYFGLFSSPIIFIILILKACIPKKFFSINFSYKFLLFGFMAALSDYFLFRFLKLCTRTTFSNFFGIQACILLLLLKINSGSPTEVFTNVYFYIEIILLISGIIIALFTYDEAEERKLLTKRRTKQNSIERISNYFSQK